MIDRKKCYATDTCGQPQTYQTINSSKLKLVRYNITSRNLTHFIACKLLLPFSIICKLQLPSLAPPQQQQQQSLCVSFSQQCDATYLASRFRAQFGFKRYPARLWQSRRNTNNTHEYSTTPFHFRDFRVFYSPLFITRSCIQPTAAMCFHELSRELAPVT